MELLCTLGSHGSKERFIVLQKRYSLLLNKIIRGTKTKKKNHKKKKKKKEELTRSSCKLRQLAANHISENSKYIE